MSEAKMASHNHDLDPLDPSAPGSTGNTGGNGSQTNMQPTLALNYLVATNAPFPGSEDPFLGEIGLFAGNFIPGGWASADGQLLSIASNSALFSLFGTAYGGDGRNTFALPDMRGMLAVGDGTGPGLTNWQLGQESGVESLIMTAAQMTAHTHTYTVAAAVSEPAAFAIFALGLGGLGVIRRRRRTA